MFSQDPFESSIPPLQDLPKDKSCLRTAAAKKGNTMLSTARNGKKLDGKNILREEEAIKSGPEETTDEEDGEPQEHSDEDVEEVSETDEDVGEDNEHDEDLEEEDEDDEELDDEWRVRVESEIKVRLQEEHDRASDRLKHSHTDEIHDLKERHNDKVETLLSKLSDANLR